MPPSELDKKILDVPIVPDIAQPQSIETGRKIIDSEQRVIVTGRSGSVDRMFNSRVFVVANGTVTAVASTADETMLETINLTGISWNVGKVIRITASGVYSTVNASDTVVVRIGIGSTAPITEWNSMTSTAASVTNQPWNLQFIGIVTAIGASGAVEAQIIGAINNVKKDDPNTATVAFDTTITQHISISADWSAADASNSISIRSFLLEILN